MRFAVALFACAALWGQSAGLSVDRLIAANAAARRATWGVLIVDLRSGATIYERNSRRLFVPASNTKLFTAALALMRLGPEHRFQTRVLATTAPGSDGVVEGDLIFAGGGDPNLSGRTIPYRADERDFDPLKAVDELADAVAAKGVRRIRGDVVGDDTAYTWEPFPEGWAADDAAWDYGAPVSALTVNDSSFRLTVRPAAPGEEAALTVAPAPPEMVIHNRVRTAAAGETKISVERPPLAAEVAVSGTIRAGGEPECNLLAVDDPALFAASVLREELLRRGVTVDGGARARHRRVDEPAPGGGGYELAVRESASLADCLTIASKLSQNLHVEMMLREVARVRRGSGSLEDGLKEMDVFLSEAGLVKDSYQFHDGSGLSRLNLLSPDAAVRLLRFMYASRMRRVWMEMLPVGGKDGTLEKRFGGAVRARFVHAKTGSMTHVNALSGYVLPEGGRAYAFSILVNGFANDDRGVRAVMDQIVLGILKRRR